jgi:hypothetical protein
VAALQFRAALIVRLRCLIQWSRTSARAERGHIWLNQPEIVEFADVRCHQWRGGMISRAPDQGGAKIRAQPLHQDFATQVSNRCGAMTRAGTACERRPMAGRKRCRLHGGLSPGAPRGFKNGNFKSGDWTSDAIAERKWLRSLGQSFAGNGTTKMNEMRNSPTSVPARDRVPPVRVRLVRPDAYDEQTRPPALEQDIKAWEARLNDALGTLSPDFVRASLLQIQSAARSPYGTISETAINAALAMVEAAAPRDEIEGALAIQMACTHTAAMSVLSKMDSGFGTERRIAAFGSTAARLMRTFTMQVEVLRRLRHGGHQFVRVEHIHIGDGGQALIGNVQKADR